MSRQIKYIMGFWGFCDLLLLAAAIASIAFSVIWRQPNLLINLTMDAQHLTAGLIMGVILLLSWLISIGALLSPSRSTTGFVVLNWAIVADSIAILVVGTSLWFYTLHIQDNYLAIWEVQSNATKIAVQDLFQCCGYFEPNDTTVAIGGFCSSPAFVAGLYNATVTTANACVGPITGYAEPMLNQVFTLVYGFMAVVISLFLASLCVIKTRQEKERFRKIDAKRGGRGFV